MGDLDELLKPPHNLKAVLSVNEAWELRISRVSLHQLRLCRLKLGETRAPMVSHALTLTIGGRFPAG